MMTRMKRTGNLMGRAAGLGTLLALTACGGGGGSGAVATPGPPCTDGGATLALVNPPNGGTGVSTSNNPNSFVEISASSPLPQTISLVLVGNGSSQTGTVITGGATPPGGTAPKYYQSFGFTFGSGTSYTVYFIDSSQPNCAATAIPGSFNT